MEKVRILVNLYGGIFSYIEDQVTAISYRYSDKTFDYTIGSSHFKDYSKNWRELLYIDINASAFVASRQYPSYNEEISKQVRLMLEKIFCEKHTLEDVWKTVTMDDEDRWEGYISDCSNPLHYNDMLHGFQGKLVYNKQLDNTDEIHIKVGETPTCPICGEDYISESERPACDDCYYGYGLDD